MKKKKLSRKEREEKRGEFLGNLLSNLSLASKRHSEEERKSRSKKEEVVVGKKVSATPGKKHAWFESNVGLIRKPILNK